MSKERVRQNVVLAEPVLRRNEDLAAALRARYDAGGTTTLNFLSSPGSGKTTLISDTLRRLQGKLRCAVIVGDLATDNDARRMQGNGAPVYQIQTGDICHLDARMVDDALGEIGSDPVDLLIIENVGNLVCPAAYSLGEHERVALLSVTEGEDKPAKYPTLFKTAGIVLVTKIDMAEAAGFDDAAALDTIRSVAPQARILSVSARTGEGMDDWIDLLIELAQRRVCEDVD